MTNSQIIAAIKSVDAAKPLTYAHPQGPKADKAVDMQNMPVSGRW